MSERLDPGPFENPCNATAIRKASRRVTQFYDSVLEPSGLRSTQFAILNQLARTSAGARTTIGQLAAALVLDRSALGHNLRPLLRDKFVRLRESDADRRRNNVVITQLGRAKYRQAENLWRLAQDRFEAGLGETKAADVRKVMHAIAHSEHLTLPRR